MQDVLSKNTKFLHKVFRLNTHSRQAFIKDVILLYYQLSCPTMFTRIDI